MLEIELYKKIQEAVHSQNTQDMKGLLVDAHIIKPNMLHEIFLMAATMGGLPILQLMAPYVDVKEHNSAALGRVVARGFQDCFEFLLPLSDPRADNSWVLGMALLHERIEMMDALIPLCDIGALNLSAISKISARAPQLLQERIAVYEQQTISACMPTKGGAIKKKI